MIDDQTGIMLKDNVMGVDQLSFGVKVDPMSRPIFSFF